MSYYLFFLVGGGAFFLQTWVVEKFSLKLVKLSLFVYPIVFLVIFLFFQDIQIDGESVRTPTLLFFSICFILNWKIWLERSD